MPDLLRPTSRVRQSFLQALAEFRAESRHRDLDPRVLAEPRTFDLYLEGLLAGTTMAPVGSGRVAQTVLWWIDGDTYLGRVSIRHALTEQLRRIGGHIGYEVRPSARRRGHGTTMLAAALPVALALGVDPALVTCDAENLASRRIIESAGGELWGELDGELRFWVPTAH
ncbi:MAG: GNAT family N-acetyltransferase [Solirubrobacteraceae bacterium]